MAFGNVASQGGAGGGFFSGLGSFFGDNPQLTAALASQAIGSQQLAGIPPVDTGGLLGAGPPLGSSEQGQAMSQLAQSGNFAGTLDEAISTPASKQDPEPKKFSERATEFVNNLDRTFDSPTKMVGLGLLGEIDPRLVYAGLLAAGLFDKEGGV